MAVKRPGGRAYKKARDTVKKALTRIGRRVLLKIPEFESHPKPLFLTRGVR